MELREQKGYRPPLIKRMGHSFLRGVSSVITATSNTARAATTMMWSGSTDSKSKAKKSARGSSAVPDDRTQLAVYFATAALASSCPNSQRMLLERKTRKTYGITASRLFQAGDLPEKKVTMNDGRVLCKDLIAVFVKEGDKIAINYTIKQIFSLMQPKSRMELFATEDRTPKYTTDVGMQRVGTWTYTWIAPWDAEKEPAVEITMSFRMDTIDLKITPANFGGPLLLASVKFESSFAHVQI